MSQSLSILREITESVRSAGALAPARGRYSRTPDFSAPTFRSTRPASDRGTTFHFSHKAKSKTNDMSEGNFSQTTSAAHQGYIERPSATEEMEPGVRDLIESIPGAEDANAQLHAGFHYPGRIVSPDRLSFGTLGETPVARREFWNDVEHNEPRKSRVQNRIIAELPCELGQADRAMVAATFCQNFEDRALPYWATLHSPTAKNDSRNYHLHITYFDRPSGRSGAGAWDFTVEEARRKKSGNRYTVRPFVNRKHPDTRDIKWVKRLRRSYCDTLNYFLSVAGVEKRHDPRSYRESGVRKEPTEHLGSKRSALESYGLETDAGVRNAKREIRWRIEEAEAPWRRRAHAIRDADHLEVDGADEEREALFAIASDGITEARRSASYEITSRLLTGRTSSRNDMLEGEIDRLFRKDDMTDFARRHATIIALSSEAEVLSKTLPSIRDLARRCMLKGEKHAKKSERLRELFDKRFLAGNPDVLFSEQEDEGFEPISAEFEIADGFDTDVADDFDKNEIDELASLLADFSGATERAGSEVEKVVDDEFDALDELAAGYEDESPEIKESDNGHGRRRRDPIEDIIVSIARSEDGRTGEEQTREVSFADHPEAWPIAETREPGDVQRLDERLAELSNREVRFHAIASRDATDLCPVGEVKDAFNRGWLVLRFEAERRGIDLDTGRQDLNQATDPERASVHTDQDPCPIRELRKNIARQRVRG